jgi:predicted ribosome quality control (RQC) complex YloA/Tae2 family protein
LLYLYNIANNHQNTIMITEELMINMINYTLQIGTNKNENWMLLDASDESNVWFHVSGVPSGYVILQTNTLIKYIPKIVIRRCAYLCKMRSISKSVNKCGVMYTYVRNVTKGKHVGEVTVSTYKTVNV